MARRQDSRKSEWLGFFNYYLSEEEKVSIRTLVDSKKKPDSSDILNSLAKQNYKVTFSLNETNGSYVCSVTGKVGNPNRGYTLAVTHVDLIVALYAIWFVVVEVYQEGEWPVEQEHTNNW